MTEKQLYALLMTTIDVGLAARSITDVDVRQADQPTIQGTPTGPAVLIQNLHSHSYGSPKVVDVWDSVHAIMNETTTQMWESTFQFGTLYPQDPTDTTGPTAADLLKSVASILQNPTTVVSFAGMGVGIYRVTDIRQPNFKDEKSQFEASPSFDLTLTHSVSETYQIPFATQVVPGLIPV